MLENLDEPYQLRGYMVQARTNREIAQFAVQLFINFINNGIQTPNIENLIDILSEQDISIHIETNAKWDRVHSIHKKGESTPSKKEIVIPKRVFDGAKKLNTEDLEVFFHEIGHVILKHSPIYMKSEGYVITEIDDAEAQADYFAEIMLKLFDIKTTPKQLSLF
ncbi:hypothetical protein HMPREF0476_1813 [Kingella kingae ATCC 23330]|uniref:IrrE N-terminal-like domain-containing protein n=3 Tax=Kingella kingae TaxID=504 RepID=F5S9D0_KINKI|nr:hypothetical protein HMPREF0476_1813 [Kingella kingae ATCC 23330]SQH24255.1 Uncharacterised protein [Kingella kingae]